MGSNLHQRREQLQAHAPASGAAELWGLLVSTRLGALLLSMLVYSFGFAVLIPYLPTLLTNYFASVRAGQSLDCQVYAPGTEPVACQDAHSDAVRWTSWTSLASNAVLAFLFSPLIGDASDAVGRKPFILAGLALAALPAAVVSLHLAGYASLLWYYPANAVGSLVPSVAMYLSYAADALPAHQRTAGFGLIIAAFSGGFMLGPLAAAAAHTGPAGGAAAAGGGCLAALLIVALAVPETRGTQVAAAATRQPQGGVAASPPHRVARPLDALLSLRRSWQLINSSALFRRLALCMAVVGVVSEGVQDMLLQYLQLAVGFNTVDQGRLFTLLGACNLVVQAALLPLLVRLLGERRLLLLGLVFSAVEQALLATARAKGQAYAAIALGSIASVSFPAISALKSMHVAQDQQGLVQGALAGIRALAAGLGPLAFAQLFAACTRSDAVLGFQPGIVFWTTCLLTLLAAGVAASLPVGQASKAGARSSTAVARTEQVVVAGAGCSAAAEADGNEQQQLLVVSVTGSGSDAVGCQQRDAVGISEKRTPHGRAGDKVELLTPLPARRTLPLSDAVAQRDAGLEGRSAQQQSQSRGSFSDGMRRLLSLSGQGVPGGGEQLPTSPGATDNGSLEPLLRPSTPQG